VAVHIDPDRRIEGRGADHIRNQTDLPAIENAAKQPAMTSVSRQLIKSAEGEAMGPMFRSNACGFIKIVHADLVSDHIHVVYVPREGIRGRELQPARESTVEFYEQP